MTEENSGDMSDFQDVDEPSEDKPALSCNNDNADIAFLVDCTRSMRRHVVYTKDNIASVVKHIRKKFKNSIRLAFVAYRDLSCPNNIQQMNFTYNVTEFTTFADKHC